MPSNEKTARTSWIFQYGLTLELIGAALRAVALLLGPLLVCIGVFACLRFGGFSQRQSFTLIGLLVLYYVIAEIAKAERSTPPEFEPLVIKIYPHFKPLLADYGLLDETKWSTVTESGDSKSTTAGKPDGQIFTALSGSLYYSNNHQSFGTKLNHMIDLRAVCLDDRADNVFDLPAFYIREKRNVDANTPELEEMLEFGLMMNRKASPKEVCLARLPKAILNRYEGAKDAALLDLGWKREWIGGDDPDVDNPLQEITHKYVTVYLRRA